MQAARLPLGTILPGDCVEAMRSLPAASIDLIFADPPTTCNSAVTLPGRTAAMSMRSVPTGTSSIASPLTTRSPRLACRSATAAEARRLALVIGSYHNIFRVGSILQDLGFWILNDIVWRKANPMPNFKGTRFANAHETLIWASTGERARYTFNYRAMKTLNDELQMRSDWVLPICGGPERIRRGGSKAHPTQKPEGAALPHSARHHSAR